MPTAGICVWSVVIKPVRSRTFMILSAFCVKSSPHMGGTGSIEPWVQILTLQCRVG